MSTIPNGISSDDLKALLATAHIDEDTPVEDEEPTGNVVKTKAGVFTEEQIIDMAQACDVALFEECPHPIAHKVLILEILTKMIHWHEQTALEKEGVESCGWAADAGKLHAARELIMSISLGDQDFTCK